MFEKGNDKTALLDIDDKSMYNLENYYKEISKTIFTLTNGKTVDEYIGLIVNKIIINNKITLNIIHIIFICVYLQMVFRKFCFIWL